MNTVAFATEKFSLTIRITRSTRSTKLPNSKIGRTTQPDAGLVSTGKVVQARTVHSGLPI